MNFKDFQEDVWRFKGVHDSTLRHDFEVQQVKDDVNRAMDDIYLSAPYFWHMLRESSLSVVANTSTYALNDYCVKPLSFWTEDQYAHKISFLSPRDVDRIGLRNSTIRGVEPGPFTVTWTPATTSAAKYGASGASEGVTLTNGSTTVTKSGGTAWASSDIGSIIKFHGEDEDYKVATFTNANSITIDKAYTARLTGTGTTGTATAPSNARWELTPIGTYQIKFVPTPQSTATVKYRYCARPRRLILQDDTPELPGQYQYLIALGAIMRTGKYAENPGAYKMYLEQYVNGLDKFIKEDRIEMDEEYQSFWESPVRRASYKTVLPQDVYYRS